jgi:hypothetical protein
LRIVSSLFYKRKNNKRQEIKLENPKERESKKKEEAPII